MTFDTRYIAAFNIEDVLLDKDSGQPLSGGIVTFEVANQPGDLKDVFQVTYTSGVYTYTPLPNPMTLSAIGTFVDALDNPVIPYFFPYDAAGNVQYYRVIVQSSGLVEQFVRDPVPSVPDSGASLLSTIFENEISNPQFAEVLFPTGSTPFVYSFNAVSLHEIDIAPDWVAVVSAVGAGSITVTQLTPTGSQNILTNPGTILQINSSGLSHFRLRQRLYGSPNLWGHGRLAATFVAKTFAGASSNLKLFYSQSNGMVTDQLLVNATLPSSGAYTAFPGSALIPISTSSETVPDAYIDIEFEIPLNTEIGLTSVMLAATGDVVVSSLIYAQDSQNRQIDHLFHYYKPELEYKPIPSYLVGWDFPLNPSQFFANGGVTTTVPALKSQYVWDQTIVFQTEAMVITTARNTANKGLNITVSSDSSFALIQYIPAEIAREILSQHNAIQLKAAVSAGTLAGTVSLWWTDDTSLPDLKSANYNSLVVSITAGVPTCGTGAPHGTWHQVRNFTRDTAVAVSSSSSLPFTLSPTATPIDFIGFAEDTTGAVDATYMAIVIAFDTMLSSQTMTIEYASLVGGDIATRPAPQTLDQVLRECQYYYEQSYVDPADVGTLTDDGGLEFCMAALHDKGTNNAYSFAAPFGFLFTVQKRAEPTMDMYSTTGLANNFNSKLFYTENGTLNFKINNVDQPWATFWDRNISKKSVIFLPKVTTALNPSVTDATTGGGTFCSAGISLQYRADARLGIIL